MNYTIGTIGSHSAEEIAISAKSFGFNTVVFCQKGREKYYANYQKHLFDHIILLDKFSDIVLPENQQKLKELETIILPNRSFTAYLGYDPIENDFSIPIYGNRKTFRLEDRNYEKNQYWFMKTAGMRFPKQYSHNNIPGLAIVKVQQKYNPMERAFFYVNSVEDLESQASQLISKEIISESEFRTCIIEEFVLGPRFNANFHAYGLPEFFGQFDFVGFDDRVQTNLNGILNLPAREQLKITIPIKNEEIGHKPLTMRESKKILVYDAAEQFLEGIRQEYAQSYIGMFALQGAINENSEFVIFDISPRIPGAPILGSTSPEMRKLRLKFSRSIESPLDLSMIEIQKAIKEHRIDEITT